MGTHLDVVTIPESTELLLSCGVPHVEADRAKVRVERERVDLYTEGCCGQLIVSICILSRTERPREGKGGERRERESTNNGSRLTDVLLLKLSLQPQSCISSTHTYLSMLVKVWASHSRSNAANKKEEKKMDERRSPACPGSRRGEGEKLDLHA
jgi:hypothetical protein